jgi:ribosomal protein S24E
MGRGVPAKLQAQNRSVSKLLSREYVEFTFDARAGKLTRKEAVAILAKEMGVAEEKVGLVRLEEQAGRSNVLGRFYIYDSKEAKARLHPKYLDERALSKEEREKLKQERKKAKAPAPAPEAKK